MALLRMFCRSLWSFGGSKYFRRSLIIWVNGNTIRDFSHIKDALDTIENNILIRKHENNVPIIRSLISDLNQCPSNINAQKRLKLQLSKLPNNTHEKLLSYGYAPRKILQNHMRHEVNNSSNVCKDFKFLRTEHLGNFSGQKSYFLFGDVATLEQSLIRFSMKYLKKIGFRLISVPDIIPRYVINSCGMQTEADRTQVYTIETAECLSGTSEMALAAYFGDHIFEEELLPVNVAAVSRCYRAETSGLNEEKGLYRLLDMPPIELGASAFRKYDIEAWMPGRQMWGEVSSCSNCTDYQTKRLNIKYREKSGHLKYAHTVNGTAAAIPRIVIALLETTKIENETISLPEALQKVSNLESLKSNGMVPAIKLVKFFKTQK